MSEQICVTCAAEEIAGGTLAEFTETCPGVKMSYAEWMVLGGIIETCVKAVFGGEEKHAHVEEAAKEPTIQ